MAVGPPAMLKVKRCEIECVLPPTWHTGKAERPLSDALLFFHINVRLSFYLLVDSRVSLLTKAITSCIGQTFLMAAKWIPVPTICYTLGVSALFEVGTLGTVSRHFGQHWQLESKFYNWSFSWIYWCVTCQGFPNLNICANLDHDYCHCSQLWQCQSMHDHWLS